MNRVKIGIIGSGFGLYGLLPAFNSVPGCEVTCIFGEKNKRLINYCKKINLKKIYTDWHVMLNKEKLDAVAIAVPPNAQYEIAKEAISKGLHIFAEKPLAATLNQASELLRLAKRKKIKHMIDFEFPEIDEWKKVKELLDRKKFGKLQQICINWDFLSFDIKNQKSTWKTNVAEGGGALSFYFCHSLHYLEYFAGEISDIKSMLSYSPQSLNGGDVGVDTLIKFKNGAVGNAHLNCNARGLNRHQLVFIFKGATIILENKNSFTSNFTVKIFTDSGLAQLPVSLERSIKKGEDERVRVIEKVAARFVKAIIQNKEPSPSFVDGVRVQQLIEKIRK